MKHSYNFQINFWIQERCVFTLVVHVIPILKCWKEEQDSLPDYIFGIWNTSHLTGEQKSCGAGILTFHVLLSALNDVMSLMCTWYMYLIIFFPSWQFYCRKIHKQIHIISYAYTTAYILTYTYPLLWHCFWWLLFLAFYLPIPALYFGTFIFWLKGVSRNSPSENLANINESIVLKTVHLIGHVSNTQGQFSIVLKLIHYEFQSQNPSLLSRHYSYTPNVTELCGCQQTLLLVSGLAQCVKWLLEFVWMCRHFLFQ